MNLQRGIFQGAFPPGLDLVSCFRLARQAGFEGVELTLESAAPLLPEARDDTTASTAAIERSVGVASLRPGGLRLESTPAEIALIRRQAEDEGLRIASVAQMLLFYYPLSSPIPAVRAHALRIVRAMLESAAQLGADLILICPAMVTQEVPYQEAWARSQEALSTLLPLAAELGVAIGVENVWNKFLLSPLEFCAYLDAFHSPLVGAYFDVANVLRYGYPDQWIELLGPRLKQVHFKDYRLDVDDIRGFTQLLQGDVPWPRVMQALKRVGYAGWAVVEVPPYRERPEQALFDAVQALAYLLTLL